MGKELCYKDLTIKARVSDRAALEKQLANLNARFMGVDLQKDTYFKVARGKLKLRSGNIENFITHYERVDGDGVERTKVYQYDLDPNLEQIASLFRTYDKLGVIEKERRIYLLDNVKIHVDLAPDNLTYVEIEVIDRKGMKTDAELRLQCLSIKDKLEIRDSELIKTGYWPT